VLITLNQQTVGSWSEVHAGRMSLTVEKVAHTEGFRLYQELCTTAGIPVN
jgi:hypothetical protein